MKPNQRNAVLLALLILTCIPVVDGAETTGEDWESRQATDAADLNYWLGNMALHQFTAEEVGLTLGVSTTDAAKLIEKFHAEAPSSAKGTDKPKTEELVILPYPGGRHPRIGFLEGAIRPQRETKFSLFAPWENGGYLVVDLPEAVWHQSDEKRELLYLAHTHIPTIWDNRGIKLPLLEWKRDQRNSLNLTRELPNKVAMTSRVHAADGGARLEFSIANGSDMMLAGLDIQMCGMLKGLSDFAQQTNDNKLFSAPFAACKAKSNDRWVILGFDHCIRAWGNAKCPCLHADPRVPDCSPGETQTVRGWVSFYEGPEIARELQRLEKLAFLPIGTP